MERRDQLDTSIEITTPENIAFRYQLAGPFQRLPAFLIDFGVRITIIFSLWICMTFLGIVLGGFVVALISVAYFVMSWFYGVILETYFNGRTLGKHVLGLRVLTDQGRPINGEQAVLRNLFRTVDLFFPLVSLIAASRGRYYQRLGDMVAGTIVIVEESRRFTHVTEFRDSRISELASALPLNLQIPRGMARCLRSYVDRRSKLTSSQRMEIAGHLATPLIDRYNLPPATNHDLLLCAMYYRAFVRDRVDDDILTKHAQDPLTDIPVKSPNTSPFTHTSATVPSSSGVTNESR